MTWVVDHEHIAHCRLRINTREMAIARVAPRKYGKLLRGCFEIGCRRADWRQQIRRQRAHWFDLHLHLSPIP